MRGKTRLEKLYTYMEKENIDLIFITLPRSVYYFTDFNTNPHERFFCLCVPLNEEPILIIPELDLEQATKKSKVKNIRSYQDNENPLDLLRKIRSQQIVKCGIQKEHLTLTRFEEIDSVIQASKYVDIEYEIQKMKAVKSLEEIEKIKSAIRISELALFEALKIVKPGVSEYEVAAEIQYQRLKLGADGGGLMVVSGEKSALPHGRTGNRLLKDGDLLLIDGGVIKEGYVSDITRTFAIGEIDSEQKRIYDTVLEANLAAINAIKPGIAFSELDKIARDIIGSKGYEKYFTHRLGHGMGMNNHEYPSIHGLNKDHAKAGMVFTIEPGIYVPSIGGVRIEDDVLVTEDGFEVLTNYTKELTIL